jgi:dolichol-phosphate mannosyltransferase
MDPDISVIVPMRNESANVIPLTQRVFAAFENVPSRIELILVDDGSTDDTWARINEAWRSYPHVRGLRHARNAGQSAALWTGFRASRGAILATLDGDLQNDPADLPKLLAELATVDMACGVRTKRADNWVKRSSSAVARVFRKLVLGVDFSDSGCNLRVFKRNVLECLPAFDGVHRFMPFFVHNIGGGVKQLPVQHHPRIAGQSKYGVWNRMGKGLRDLIMVRWYLKRQIGRVPFEATPISDELLEPKPSRL